ncbi:MAG TPA: hypothetical protein VG099_18340, partial [Gemmataceae bacterium]|nr:hypothetical protein [Gemmataceae bacterium]
MAASLVVLSVLLGGSAQAQDGTRATNPPTPYPSTSTLPTTDSYYYTKPAGNAPVAEKKLILERPASNYQTPGAARTGAWPGTATPAGNFYSTGYQSPKVQKGTVSPEAAGASPAVSGRGGDEVQGFAIRLEPPGPQEIFGRLDSEANLQERIRQKAREQTPVERVEFPPEPVVG